MTKEKTIRNHCKDSLIEQDYIVCVPNRSRYGSFSNYLPEHQQGDDLFQVFDLVAWKDDELLFVQYTSKKNIATRENKINEFFGKTDVELPRGCRIEVWGYINQSGGDFEIRKVTDV